jgi:hypothetical protein
VSVVLIDSESSEVFIYLKRHSIMAMLLFSNAIYASIEEDSRGLRF